MIAAGKSDVGLVRSRNQDLYFISKDKNLPLYILADGMGGEKGGEIASRMAVDTTKEVFVENMTALKNEATIKTIIRKSIEKSNTNIHKRSLEDKNLEGMGTTLLILYISGNSIYIGHVGDSRVYYIQDGIDQLTEDHSLVNALLKTGELSIEEAKNHPQKNMITKAVGASATINPDILTYKDLDGGKVLLCSDGLTSMVSDKRIYSIIESKDHLEDVCDGLIDEALKSGGRDNITTIIVKL